MLADIVEKAERTAGVLLFLEQQLMPYILM